ncbi:hypothetical protein ACEPAI_8750 [Sanghuangporus weigelae]
MGYSNVGKTRLKVYGLLCVLNIIVLALSSRVNQFLDFFFMADLFPFILSIITLVFLSAVLLLDFAMYNPFTSRPPFEIGCLMILSVLWLASNTFSTSRWRFVPLSCGSIPEDFSAERTWCRDLQALKAFVWIEWVVLLLTTVLTIRYAVIQHVHGNKQIWRTALSRYVPKAEGGMHRRNTSFFSGFGNNDFSISDAHIERTY